YDLSDSQGQRIQLRAVTLFSQYGTSFSIAGIATPSAFEATAQAVDQMAASVQLSSPTPNPAAITALEGSWRYTNSNVDPAIGPGDVPSSNTYEEFVSFDGQGNFQWQSVATVSVDGYLHEDRQNDQGTYTVIGRDLVLRAQQGGVLVGRLELFNNGFHWNGRPYGR
ncbi:MAG: hypothetical protein AAFS10_14990, partial [Myxococcota bacterium]